MSLNKITLKIWTPEKLILETRADKVIAEAVNGFFCLLPRHVDYLAGLIPSILSYTDAGEEYFLAVDKGILVKCGMDVMVSVRNAIQGEVLEDLESDVRNKYQRKDQKEEEISIAMNQLEADLIRRFVEINKQRGRGWE